MTDVPARRLDATTEEPVYRPGPPEARVTLQLVTERILLSALRESDAAAVAEVARRRAEFLSEASRRFGASLDQEVTYAAIAGVIRPGLEGWCIVDIVELGGGLRRLAVVHPDESKHVAASALADLWRPAVDDRLGVPLIERDRQPVIIIEGASEAIVRSARDPETLRVLRWLGAGSLLVVPIIAHDKLLGAITYVSRPGAPAYSPVDVEFGVAFAERCAQAVEAARLYAAARAAWQEAEAVLIDANMARADAEAARKEAEEANATKSNFLRTMSHELRTPLNAIDGYAQIMEMGIHGPVTADQMEDLGRIRRSQVHLLGLINAVLYYAKLETGHVEFEMRSLPVADAIDWAHSLIAPQARTSGVSLSLKCDRTISVKTDQQKLRQVLVNVLSNAVKFTTRGGSVELTCACDDTNVMIGVHDTGIGIPADKLLAIFEPFVQVNNALTRQHEGSGLGLAISRDLVRGMDGDLSVRSVLGEGSTFTITLPVGD
ncbi:MAG: GAF domain-containing sensor histidine kinase [bacterium]